MQTLAGPVDDPGTVSFAGIRRGARAGLPFLISSGVTGLIMGVTYHQLGVPLLLAVALSAFVFSGTAQAATASLWSVAPLPYTAMALTVLAINMRYVVMGAYLRRIFPRLSTGRLFGSLALLTDGAWAIAVRQAEEKDDRDGGVLLGASLPMWLAWVAGTAAGHSFVIEPKGPLAAAAAFMPLALVASLIPLQIRGRRRGWAWLVAAAVAAALWTLLPATWAVLLGAIAGMLAEVGRGDGQH
jgi:predicted branched-subunit amino acid permease